MNIVFSLISFFCLLSNFLTASDKLPNQRHPTLSFEVEQQDYLFSTILHITSEHSHLGYIVKSALRIRTSYELFNPKYQYEGVGVCRFLTPDRSGAWRAQIEIFDSSKAKIGEIDGQVVPGNPACFFLHNEEKACVGIAHLDPLKSKFTIVSPKNEQHRLVSLKRHYVRGMVDYWNVTIHELDAIDLRLIKIFAAFAIDAQDDFRED